MIGFVLVLLILGVWGGLMWAFWEYVLHEKSIPGLGLFDIFTFSLFFLGIPLAFVGHYAGLRYRLTRTRWRGIRCDLGGSAWGYGAKATGLHLANGLCGQLLMPLMSVLLAQPRIAMPASVTQRLEFAGRAGDIYGRFIGYYFLNILAWIVAIAVAVTAVTWGGKKPRHHRERTGRALHSFHAAHGADPDRPRLRTLRAVRRHDPAAALLVAGLSLALPRLAHARRHGAVRVRDVDPPNVGVPGAELPDRHGDARARLAVGRPPHRTADRRPALALRQSRRGLDPPAARSDRRASARGCSRCST